MSTIKAIETRYAGCRFRSRLEARWAVFFDTLGVAWQYEPEGFDLDGTWYLPDFYLPTLNAYYEVKGTKPSNAEDELVGKLARGTGKDAYIAWGDIPATVHPCGTAPWYGDLTGINAYRWISDDEGRYLSWDGWNSWCVCPRCGAVGIEFEARAARLHERGSTCPHAEFWGRGHAGDHPRILAAYEAARSARFEHGERG